MRTIYYLTSLTKTNWRSFKPIFSAMFERKQQLKYFRLIICLVLKKKIITETDFEWSFNPFIIRLKILTGIDFNQDKTNEKKFKFFSLFSAVMQILNCTLSAIFTFAYIKQRIQVYRHENYYSVIPIFNDTIYS